MEELGNQDSDYTVHVLISAGHWSDLDHAVQVVHRHHSVQRRGGILWPNRVQHHTPQWVLGYPFSINENGQGQRRQEEKVEEVTRLKDGKLCLLHIARIHSSHPIRLCELPLSFHKDSSNVAKSLI